MKLNVKNLIVDPDGTGASDPLNVSDIDCSAATVHLFGGATLEVDFDLEGTLDGTHWFVVTGGSALDESDLGVFSLTDPVVKLRVNVTTLDTPDTFGLAIGGKDLLAFDPDA